MHGPYTTQSLIIDGIIAAGIFGFGVAAVLWHWMGRPDRQDEPDASAIITYYTAGHFLLNAGSGTTDGLQYTMYMTTPAEKQYGQAFVQESAIVYVLNLPFNTQAHILGLSKSYQLDRLKFEAFLKSNALEKIELEGDFPDYFDIYAGQDQDFQVRYVLDPAAMEFVEKYCQTHFWELHDSELYFVVTDSGIGNVNFITEGQQFVDAIRPALPIGDPNAPVVHHGVPYDIYDGPLLACPLCRQTMELHDNKWFQCAAGHGVLMTGHELERLDNRELTVQMDAAKTVHHGPLSCPHCQHPMEPVQYQGGKLQIDTCTNCPFRWLDADEVVQILSRRRLFGFGFTGQRAGT